jgi:hypothetical protein
MLAGGQSCLVGRRLEHRLQLRAAHQRPRAARFGLCDSSDRFHRVLALVVAQPDADHVFNATETDEDERDLSGRARRIAPQARGKRWGRARLVA